MYRIAILSICLAFSTACSSHRVEARETKIALLNEQATIRPSTTAPDTITRSFVLQSGGNIKVSNVNGGIKISAWDKNEVALTAEFKPNSNDEHAHIEVNSKSDSLELTAKYPRESGLRRSASCNMELKVPRRVIANINNVNGGIYLDSITGTINSNNVNGGISLDSVAGKINANNVNGGIGGSIQSAEGNLDISTVNGGIKVKLLSPNGSLSASTVNGSITLKTPGANNLETKKNKTNATFGSGNATMTFSTVNGGITIE